jgi:HPt (histidine-containing phosphotransfer) domain-containing protein
MIDRSRFDQFSRHFDKELIVEIIDVFIREYPSRIESLRKNIDGMDFINLAENSHCFKGALSNFMAPDPIGLCRKLQELAEQERSEELEKTFLELKSTTAILILELEALRMEFLA